MMRADSGRFRVMWQGDNERLARTLLEGSDEPAALSAEELVQLIAGDGSSDESA